MCCCEKSELLVPWASVFLNHFSDIYYSGFCLTFLNLSFLMFTVCLSLSLFFFLIWPQDYFDRKWWEKHDASPKAEPSVFTLLRHWPETAVGSWASGLGRVRPRGGERGSSRSSPTTSYTSEDLEPSGVINLLISAVLEWIQVKSEENLLTSTHNQDK